MKSHSLNTLAWQRLRKNKLSFFALCYIMLVALTSLFAVVISPDSTPNANQMNIELSTIKPFTKVLFLQIPKQENSSASLLESVFLGIPSKFNLIAIDGVKESEENRIIYFGYRSKIEQEYIGPYNVVERIFWLGTDKYGRDLLSRILVGSRISISIGFVAVFISLFLGITLGLFAGYFGGRTDNVIMWCVNVIWSIPTLLMVIAITLALGKGFWQVFVAVGLTMWVEVARIVRGQVLVIRSLEFIKAGEALAYKSFRIIYTHIFPNVIGPIIVISASNFAAAILIESGLSFLGIGAQPPMSSWGGIIKDHYPYIIMDKAYLAIIPGLAIMSLVLAFILLGNGLRDAFDVKN